MKPSINLNDLSDRASLEIEDHSNIILDESNGIMYSLLSQMPSAPYIILHQILRYAQDDTQSK